MLVPQIRTLSVLQEVDDTSTSMVRLLMEAEAMRTVYAHLWTKVMGAIIVAVMQPGAGVRVRAAEEKMDFNFETEEGTQPSFYRLYMAENKEKVRIDVGNGLAKAVCAGVDSLPGIFDSKLKALHWSDLMFLETCVSKARLVLKIAE